MQKQSIRYIIYLSNNYQKALNTHSDKLIQKYIFTELCAILKLQGCKKQLKDKGKPSEVPAGPAGPAGP